MSNTINVPIENGAGWVEIATGAQTGKLSFSSNFGATWCKFDSAPDEDLIGHPYSSKTVDFSLSGSEKLYGRSVSGDVSAIVTSD